MNHEWLDPRWEDADETHRPVFSDSEDLIGGGQTTGQSHEAIILEMNRLRHANHSLQRELQRLRKQNSRLRERFVEQTMTRGVATVDDAVHARLADRFLDLVQQDMQHIVRLHLQECGGQIRPRRVAYGIKAVCQELLTEKTDSFRTCMRLGMDPDVHKTHMLDLISKVSALTSQVPSEVWNFDAVVGSYPDPQRQYPWGQCSSHHYIDFVVAPAYQINGRTYARQLVFTAPKHRWRR